MRKVLFVLFLIVVIVCSLFGLVAQASAHGNPPPSPLPPQAHGCDHSEHNKHCPTKTAVPPTDAPTLVPTDKPKPTATLKPTQAPTQTKPAPTDKPKPHRTPTDIPSTSTATATSTIIPMVTETATGDAPASLFLPLQAPAQQTCCCPTQALYPMWLWWAILALFAIGIIAIILKR